MAELNGNILVAQSGGPTSVINASVAGVVSEALNHECIEEVYGGLNGVLGILQEEIIDLAAESQHTIRALRHTPGAALGSCRHKIKKAEEYDRILKVFAAHNIRYFFYAGGNDSQDTADRIAKLAVERGYELRVMGVPKTIDNDLPITDHCPGYGSVIKYIATTVREMACDNLALATGDFVSILEVMGRSAGWIAAGASLAKRKDHPHDPPQIILLPEVAFSPGKFIEDVQRVLRRDRYCIVVVGEGLVDKDGNYVAVNSTATDAFGHAALGGAAEYLKGLLETSIKTKARTAKLGYVQRAAVHCSSQTDNNEAFLVGQAAVKFAVSGKSGQMVTLVRGDGEHYKCEVGLTPLSEIANSVKPLPREWIHEDGISMNYQFRRYALPLIQGEVVVPYESGLPVMAHLDKIRVNKLLDPYQVQ